MDHEGPPVSFSTLVILDTAWGPSQLKKLFLINTEGNKSGRLLKRIMDTPYILVCNACETTTKHACLHGEPDVGHLAGCVHEALTRFPAIKTFLVAGKVAQETFDEMVQTILPLGAALRCAEFRILRIPHPAARFWTHDMMDRAKTAIADTTITRWELTK
jgi:hypothetical protein